MKNYAYVLRVQSPRTTYTTTGDGRGYDCEGNVLCAALEKLAEDACESLSDLDVLAFSCMEVTPCV